MTLRADKLDSLWQLDATELARRIRTKEVSPVEVVRAHLARIEAINARLHAVVTLIEDAEERARLAEAALMRGDALGPLHGVPFSVKDSLDVAGTRTTRGSQLFATHIPEHDATVVTRLKAAGGIAIGKTNVPEFSFARETANLIFGRTVNPWNPDRTPGGSSGGEAAAIAAGLSPLGIGSDLAVSIRGPAHYCGIVGLKATHGRIPLTGHWPETLRRFWHVGPMARTVRDTALALSVMAGPDGVDGHARPAPPCAMPGGAPLPPLRVGWMAERGFGPVDPDVTRTVQRAADTLRDLGCHVEAIRIPGLEARDWNTLSTTLFWAEAGPYFRSLVAGREVELYPGTRRWLPLHIESLDHYVAAQLEVEELQRDLMAYFRNHDALVCPVSPVPAFAHDITELTVGGVTLPARHVVRPTVPFNLTGLPAIAVPFGWSSEGLPIGVQVIGRHFDESTVLHVAMALESCHDARGRWPTL